MAEETPITNARIGATANEQLIGMAKMGAQAFSYTADPTVDRGLAQLLRPRVAQLNDCTYCLDLDYEAAREAGIPRAKIDTLTAWWETMLFSPAEHRDQLRRGAHPRDRDLVVESVPELSRGTRRALQRGADPRDPGHRRQHEHLDPNQARRGRDARPLRLKVMKSRVRRPHAEGSIVRISDGLGRTGPGG